MSWRTLSAADPELAAAGEDMLRAFSVGYLATLRADGSPRITPVSVTLHDGGLYVFLIASTPKARALARDGRYALHAFPRPWSDDGWHDEEFSVAGVATEVLDSGLRAAVAAAHNDSAGEDHRLFELGIGRAFHRRRTAGGLVRRSWRAP